MYIAKYTNTIYLHWLMNTGNLTCNVHVVQTTATQFNILLYKSMCQMGNIQNPRQCAVKLLHIFLYINKPQHSYPSALSIY